MTKDVSENLLHWNASMDHEEHYFQELEKVFKTLKGNKAIGWDLFNGNTVIDVYDSTKVILFKVFKTSLEEAVFFKTVFIIFITCFFIFWKFWIKFPELVIDGMTTERETVTRFLGVFIDESATWKDHINTVSTKISKSISILYRPRLIVPRKQLNQLYFLFVHSYLNYGNLAWRFTQKTRLSLRYRQQKHSMKLLSLPFFTLTPKNKYQL